MKLKGMLLFVAGAVAGAVVAAHVTKQKYETILDEEIQSVKDVYSKKEVKEAPVEIEKEEEIVTVEEKKAEQEELSKYADILNNQGYTNYNKFVREEVIMDETSGIPDPYIIDDEDEYDEEYDRQVITLYSDGVFVDDLDDLVVDPGTMFGEDNLRNAFEEAGARSVTIRNELYRVDYEIIRDDWAYADLNQDIYPASEVTPQHLISETQKRPKKPHEL